MQLIISREILNMPKLRLRNGGVPEPLQLPILPLQFHMNAKTLQAQLIISVMDAIGMPIVLPCADNLIGLMRLAVSWQLTRAAHVVKKKSRPVHLTLTLQTLTVTTVVGMQINETHVDFSIIIASPPQPIAANVVALQQ